MKTRQGSMPADSSNHLDDTLLQPRKRTGAEGESFFSDRTGEKIEVQLTQATAPALSILHKQEAAGCLHPAECWPICACLCPVLKKRTINWIGENALLRNTPIFVLYWPFSCSFCTTEDYTRMMLLDQHPFHPYCSVMGSPCGAIGYATEEDMLQCFCVDCRRPYNVCLKPCFGQMIVSVPCENGSRGFKISMQWCLICVWYPLGICMADSKTYRAVLMEQVAHTQGKELTEKQRASIARGPPLAHGMVR